MEPEIEKGIPISPRIGKGYRTRHKLLLEKLEVGDSFVVPKSQVRNLYVLTKKRNMKIVSRTVTEPPHDKGDFMRVWRVK